jgi:hypothetical protein
LFETGKWKLESGNWRLESGNWELGTWVKAIILTSEN